MKWVPLDVVFASVVSRINGRSRRRPTEYLDRTWLSRADVFNSGFRFDVSIGPRGTSYAQGSETEFVRRLGKHKYASWHVHSAEVEHFIRDYQLRKSWILGRAIRFGRGQYRLNQAARSIPRFYGSERRDICSGKYWKKP